MQPEPAAKTSSPRRKYFFIGVLVELLLITGCFLPESWLQVEIRNFTLVTHIPLLVVAEGFGAAGIVFLLFGFAAMSWLWGLVVLLIEKGTMRLWRRLEQKQKKIAWFALAFAGLSCLTMVGISAMPQTPRPYSSSPETQSVVDANNAFALDLFQKLKDKPGNLFFSPYSISAALAMTCDGARGQTETEMTNTLHFSLPRDKLHPVFKVLTARLNGLERWNRIMLKCANSLWCQKDSSFTPDFLRTVRENYSAEAKQVDFKNAAGPAADEINRWINAKTASRIPAAVAPELLTPDTRLALCDVIYFKGKWQHQFKKKDTKPGDFQVATNESVTVPMMWQRAPLKHAMTQDYAVEMLELPYVGNDLSMVILLPGKYALDSEHNDVHDLEQKLTPEYLRAWLHTLDGIPPVKPPPICRVSPPKATSTWWTT